MAAGSTLRLGDAIVGGLLVGEMMMGIIMMGCESCRPFGTPEVEDNPPRGPGLLNYLTNVRQLLLQLQIRTRLEITFSSIPACSLLTTEALYPLMLASDTYIQYPVFATKSGY
jgi:hypothetical protein